MSARAARLIGDRAIINEIRSRAAAGRGWQARRPGGARHLRRSKREGEDVCAVGALALQVLLVLAMLFAVTFDRAYYSSEYERLGVYESCGADAVTLERATDILLEYCAAARTALAARA